MFATFVVFMCTVFPVVAFVSFVFFGPLGLVSALFTTTHYSNALLLFLVGTLFMPHMQLQIFDSVLAKEGRHELVEPAKRRISEPKSVSENLRTWWAGARLALPLFLGTQVAALALGMVPILGPLAAAQLSAPRKARGLHSRYFQLKGWTADESEQFYNSYFSDYWLFGAVAILLETVPLMSIFFHFTNIVGVALWTVELD